MIKLKKIFLLFVLFLLVGCEAMFVTTTTNSNGETATTTNNNNNNNTTTTNDNGFNKELLLNMSNFVANIQDAKSIGIVNKKTSNPSTRKNKKYADKEKIQVLVKESTVEYDKNSPEVNEDGTINITFTKITTENTTNIINGEKMYVAVNNNNDDNGYISISTKEEFTYSIYDKDGNEVYSGLQDGCGLDLNEEKNTLTIGNLMSGENYTVKYTGYGTETIITQEELGAEIDKYYVCDEYVFVSYVPIGLSLRSGNLKDYDSDGYLYDKTNYFTSNDRVSFVINSRTGKIYMIENINISYINYGLVQDSNKFIYNINVKDDILYFEQLFSNSKIEVYDFFKDCYGRNYISNDKINYFDENTNTVFYINGLLEYEGYECADYYWLLKETREVMHVEFYDRVGIYNLNIKGCIKSWKIVKEDGTERELTTNDNYTIRDKSPSDRHYYKINNGLIHCYWMTGNGYFTDCAMFNTPNGDFNIDVFTPGTLYAVYNFPNNETVIIQKEGKMYSAKVDFNNPKLLEDKSNWTLISSNLNVGMHTDLIIKTTIDGEFEYKIFEEFDQNNQSYLTIQEISTYVAPDRISIELTPLN